MLDPGSSPSDQTGYSELGYHGTRCESHVLRRQPASHHKLVISWKIVAHRRNGSINVLIVSLNNCSQDATTFLLFEQ